jgi:protein-tyrosine sulfotransferase
MLRIGRAGHGLKADLAPHQFIKTSGPASGESRFGPAARGLSRFISRFVTAGYRVFRLAEIALKKTLELKTSLSRILGGREAFLDPKRYVFPVEEPAVGAEALQTARRMRGSRLPAIILHGVMQRSGTVFTGELLGLHPDLYSYPREVYEFPFLQMTGEILALHKDFVSAYENNRDKILQHDFLALTAAPLLAHLYAAAPIRQRMLLKVPNSEYLPYFYAAFPFENLLILMRDGRDVVTSTMRTWPNLNFIDVCRRWNYSARLILQCNKKFSDRPSYFYARYEDVSRSSDKFVRAVCRRFGLDEDRYPFEKINQLPVRGSSVYRPGDEVSWEAVERPKQFQTIGRWKSWSEGQKKTFKKICGQTLIDLGYCEDLNW